MLTRLNLLVIALCASVSLMAQQSPDWAIVIHGGAGTINRENMTPDKETAYRAALDSALTIGAAVLESGGSSAEAVEQTIRYMEDNPLFNSGKGAVFTADETIELDASFMEGRSRNAGAVAGVTTVKHPISAARMVMDSSVHVMMAGSGAEMFAKEKGLEMVDNSYFHTESRLKLLRWQQAQETGPEGNDGAPLIKKYGTVGCVALDIAGNLAAGTSTGGMSNKRYGRVGDSPIVGAGTFADNKTCAVSCTGHGEFFIRWVVAYDVAAIMEYAGLPLSEAADIVVNKKLVEAGGSGGLIALDAEGNISMPFNSEGMYRGYQRAHGDRVIAIYGDE